MTNKELCNFLIARTKEKTHGMGMANPYLAIHKIGKNLCLVVRFEHETQSFIIRFTQGNLHAVFKLTAIDKAFDDWYAALLDILHNTHKSYISYDDANLPQSLKNKVSATLVQAFRTKNMGIEIFGSSTIEIVKPNESYEEISIENDLNFAQSDIFSF